MACLCSRLRAGSFQNVTTAEVDFLAQTLQKAPFLFNPTVSPKSRKKRKRSKEVGVVIEQSDVHASGSSANILETSYPDLDVQELLKNQGAVWISDPLSILKVCNQDFSASGYTDVMVGIYVALKHIGQSNEINQVLRRIHSVVFSELHEKGRNVNDTTSQIRNSQLIKEDHDKIKERISKALRVGYKWQKIISHCKGHSGVLCVVGKGYLWERANEETCVNAIAKLGIDTDLYVQAERYSSSVNTVVRHLKTKTGFFSHSTVGPTGNQPPRTSALQVVATARSRFREGTTLSQRPQSQPDAHNISDLDPKPNRSNTAFKRTIPNPQSRIADIDCAPNGLSGTSVSVFRNDASDWKNRSEAAASEAEPRLLGNNSGNPTLLLVLLSFLDSSQLTKDVLHRGGTSRKRWSECGEIEEVTAIQAGLVHEVVALLSNNMELDSALTKLLAISAIQMEPGQSAFTLDDQVKARVSERLSGVLRSFWRRQALLLISHGFPRPYLDSGFRDLGILHLSHLQYTLQAFENHEHNGELPINMQNDLVLTLLAASELPGNGKKYAITRAKDLSQSMASCYLHACIAHRESTLYRVLRRLDLSSLVIGDFLNAKTLSAYETDEASARVHAQIGHLRVSSAINLMQQEKLNEAVDELHTWEPLNSVYPLISERIVLYHRNLTLGKVLRYQGHFLAALKYLTQSFRLAEGEDLLNEVRCDLLCNLGDVHIELNEPIHAKSLLQAELNHLSNRGQGYSKESRLLTLSLAEAFMRQAQYNNAEALYLEIQANQTIMSGLTRVGRLRLYIGLARTSHIKSEWADAYRYWNGALKLLNEHYPVHNGHTSAMILYSMHHLLLQKGDLELSQKSLDEMKQMESLAKPEGCQFWIAGLSSYWFDYIRSELSNACSST